MVACWKFRGDEGVVAFVFYLSIVLFPFFFISTKNILYFVEPSCFCLCGIGMGYWESCESGNRLHFSPSFIVLIFLFYFKIKNASQKKVFPLTAN